MSEMKYENMGIKEIKEYLPNRYPLLMIDGVTKVIPGKTASGYKHVTINEGFFRGHFPDKPLMPGMLQMESLLQMLSLTVLTLEKNRGKSVRAISANRIKLKERVLPGSRLDIEAELEQWDGCSGKGNARGIVDGKEACSAEFEIRLFD